MSKGLGRVERSVLAYMAERHLRDVRHGRTEPWPVLLCVAVQVAEVPQESVRRAFKTLAAKGHVVLGWDNGLRDSGGECPDGSRWFPAGPTALLSDEYLSTLTTELDAAAEYHLRRELEIEISRRQATS